ncbi:MAG: nitroreductase family protein [Candidatus Bathyarchaeia archaeon]
MDAFEAIKKRRSVRNFTGEGIPREDLEKIVDAGRLAPSGNNRQPWDFIVVTDREMIKKLAMSTERLPSSRKPIYWIVQASTETAGVFIDIAAGFPTKEEAEKWKAEEERQRKETSPRQSLRVIPLYPADTVHRWMEKAGAIIAVVMDTTSRWWLEDGSAAVENMLIASTALGYGSCWLEGYTNPHEEEFKAFLGVPKERKLFTLVAIGVAEEWPERKKKPLSQVIHWERW